TAKALLATRPIFHKTDAGIRGHVFCTFLALVLRKELFDRLAPRRRRLEWQRIVDDLADLSDVDLHHDRPRARLRTPPRPPPAPPRAPPRLPPSQPLRLASPKTPPPPGPQRLRGQTQKMAPNPLITRAVQNQTAEVGPDSLEKPGPTRLPLGPSQMDPGFPP